MPDHKLIYEEKAELYDQLISREDYKNNIYTAITDIRPVQQIDIIDLGAGTGRLTCMLAPKAKSIISMDLSRTMLHFLEKKLNSQGIRHYKTRVADNRSLPLDNHCSDMVVAGWTISYIASSNHREWKNNLSQAISEMKRVLRPGGTIVILETLGTGFETPYPPDFLGSYYQLLVKGFGFSHKWIRTDYHFESVDEAEQLTRFFFGDKLADSVKNRKSNILPECTGVWWLHI